MTKPQKAEKPGQTAPDPIDHAHDAATGEGMPEPVPPTSSQGDGDSGANAAADPGDEDDSLARPGGPSDLVDEPNTSPFPPAARTDSGTGTTESFGARMDREREQAQAPVKSLVAELEKAATKGHGLDSDRRLMGKAAGFLREALGLSPDESVVPPDHPLAPVAKERPMGWSLPGEDPAPATAPTPVRPDGATPATTAANDSSGTSEK